MFTHLTEGHHPFLLVQEPRRDGGKTRNRKNKETCSQFSHTEKHLVRRRREEREIYHTRARYYGAAPKRQKRVSDPTASVWRFFRPLGALITEITARTVNCYAGFNGAFTHLIIIIFSTRSPYLANMANITDFTSIFMSLSDKRDPRITAEEI